MTKRSGSATMLAAALVWATAGITGTVFAEQPDKWVSYVEANGGQYVDTGVRGRYGTKVECRVEWMKFSDSAFLAAGDWENDTRLYVCYCHDYDGRIYTAQGTGENVNWTGGSSGLWDCWLETNRVYNYTAEFSALDGNGESLNTINVDGLSLWSKSSPGIDTGCNLYIFACNKNGDAISWSKTRCYGLKIWQDGNLVRDFQPCMKGGRAGLYDAVSGDIFYSGTSSDLICDENSEVPDEFIEYVESQGIAGWDGHYPAYIDTGVIGRSGTKMSGEFAILLSEDNGFLGSRSGDNRFYLLQSYRTKITCGYGLHKENSQTLELGKKYWVETELNV
ncbi:MAG: hypothetical protein IKO55_08980 [Kiritimatiellae bacterium]|nr:hypothetical protein [Kiritimatiellia bacterium]